MKMADHAFKIVQPEKPFVNALVGLMDPPVPTVVRFLYKNLRLVKTSGVFTWIQIELLM